MSLAEWFKNEALLHVKHTGRILRQCLEISKLYLDIQHVPM